MLYTTRPLAPEVVPNGYRLELYGLPINFEKKSLIASGMNPDHTVCIDEKGNPIIKKLADNDLYMLVSTTGHYHAENHWTIRVLKRQKKAFEIIARNNKLSTISRGLSYHDTALLKVTAETALIRARFGFSLSDELLLIHAKSVIPCHLDNLERICRTLRIEVPCKIINSDCGMKFFGRDWISL